MFAITREVSPAMQHCELTHLERAPIDIGLAREQHREYEKALTELGCEVHSLPTEPDLPDSVFVEDAAIVLDELAIITRPGAESRRCETEAIARALAAHRELRVIEPPGTIDGGDVLRVGRTLYVGLSSRTNASAIAQVREHLAPLHYQVNAVTVTGCLHLKSAVTQVSADTLLLNPVWVDRRTFGAMHSIDVDASEPGAANALLIGAMIVYPSAYPATRERLARHGIPMRLVEVSEVLKAEGAVTCCSLVFRAREP